MSKENVKKFFAELEKNSELKEKYQSAMKSYQQETDKILSEKLLALGSKSGFTFTEKDLHDARAELVDGFNSNGELDDKDLVAAAGGANGRTKAAMVLASVFTVGIACAVTSAVTAANKTGCGNVFSATKTC